MLTLRQILWEGSLKYFRLHYFRSKEMSFKSPVKEFSSHIYNFEYN